MKTEILIYLFCISFFSSCCSISIIQDHIEDDDTRYIRTNSNVFYLKTDKGRVKYYMSVGAVHKYDTVWNFIISSRNVIPSPANLFLKLNNDSVIHLYCDNVYNDTTKTYKAEVKSNSVKILSSTLTTSDITISNTPSFNICYSALFGISPRDFSLLNRHKIVKMRIIAKDKYGRIVYIDGEPVCLNPTRGGYSDYSLSGYIQECFSKIKKIINVPVPPRKRLYDEF